MSVLAWEETIASVPAVARGLRESNVASAEPVAPELRRVNVAD